MTEQQNNACAQQQVIVRKDELPLCCPPPGKNVHNVHPRVYLNITKTGRVTCPYCGTLYILEK